MKLGASSEQAAVVDFRAPRRSEKELSLSSADLLGLAGPRRVGTILADRPWLFVNRTDKIAPEHRRLSRYGTVTMGEIAAPSEPQISLLNWRH